MNSTDVSFGHESAMNDALAFHPHDPARPEPLESQTVWHKLGDLDVSVVYTIEPDEVVVDGVNIGEAYIEACAFSRGTVSEWRADIEGELHRLAQGYVSRRPRPPFSDIERIDYLIRTFGMSRQSIDAGMRAELTKGQA
jgi:hypothetical protein